MSATCSAPDCNERARFLVPDGGDGFATQWSPFCEEHAHKGAAIAIAERPETARAEAPRRLSDQRRNEIMNDAGRLVDKARVYLFAGGELPTYAERKEGERLLREASSILRNLPGVS